MGKNNQKAKIKNKQKKEKTHHLSKVTIKYKPKDNLGWELEGDGPDGYNEIKGFSVKKYEDGYEVGTEFISEDMHEIRNKLKKFKFVIAYYKNADDKNTITKRQYEFLKFIEDQEAYYKQLLDDLENL